MSEAGTQFLIDAAAQRVRYLRQDSGDDYQRDAASADMIEALSARLEKTEQELVKTRKISIDTTDYDCAEKHDLASKLANALERLDDANSKIQRLKDTGYDVMVDARQILGVCEQEWRAENAWTGWDQGVIDRLVAWQLMACPK
jgi:hypothetical protein